jgi:hypothetical protein
MATNSATSAVKTRRSKEDFGRRISGAESGEARAGMPVERARAAEAVKNVRRYMVGS